jgi:hypothetical protein
MTDFLEANLKALHDSHPELKVKGLNAEGLKGAKEKPAIRFEQTPSGYPTAKFRGTYLHSRYDPPKEAKRIVSSEAGRTGKSPSAAVLLGFGLGYLAEAFSESFPDKPLLVIEKDEHLFSRALTCRDLSKLFSKPGLKFCIGEEAEAVMMRVEQLPLQQLCILRVTAVQHNPYYQRIGTLLSSIFDKRRVNINTLRRFGELWVRNLLSNLQSFITNPGIRIAKDSFTGIPALVVAAGPSLDEVLPLLGSLRERFLIVAVDTSYRFCRAAGVEADFLVTVDPQYWNSRHLDWLERNRTVLVSESSAHPRVFHTSEAPAQVICYVSSFFPLGKYIEEILGERGLIGAGGSVATTAWDLCRYLGCCSIHMAGLDLGFPGKKTHAKGAFFEEAMHIQSSRIATAEQMSFAYVHQAQPTALRNNRGGLTLTDRRMLIYKSWFENQFKQQSRQGGPATFTLAAEGLAVEGMQYTRPSELLRFQPVRNRIDGALTDLRDRGRQMKRKQRPDLVVQSLRQLVGELDRLQELAGRGAELSGSRSTPDTLVPALAEVDEQIMELASRQIVGFLFQPLVHSILENPSGARNFSQVLATSRQLYTELGESAAYHRQLLLQSLKRL